MKRTTLLLIGLGAVVVVVAWYFLMWTPKADAIEEFETQITDVQAQQATARTRMGELQAVRERAPEVRAALTAAETVLPRETELPSALRQLQLAAVESDATLVAVSPSRPEAVEGVEGLYSLAVSAELRGTYYQIIDVLRRLEDPAISPRGFSWKGASIAVDTELEAPYIIVTLEGHMFAALPEPPVSADAPAVAPAAGEAAEASGDGEDAADQGTDAEEVAP